MNKEYNTVIEAKNLELYKKYKAVWRDGSQYIVEPVDINNLGFISFKVWRWDNNEYLASLQYAITLLNESCKIFSKENSTKNKNNTRKIYW